MKSDGSIDGVALDRWLTTPPDEDAAEDWAADAYAYLRVRLQAYVQEAAFSAMEPFNRFGHDTINAFLADLAEHGIRHLMATRAYLGHNEWLQLVQDYREANPTPSVRARQLREATEERYYRGPLPGLVTQATRRHHWVWLGAEDLDEGELAPLDALKADLQRAIAEVDAMLAHDHHWNGEDYCDICGLDGRA